MNNKERKIIKLQNKFDALDDAYNLFNVDFFIYKSMFNKKSQKALLNDIHRLRHKLSILTKDIKNTYFIQKQIKKG